MDISLPSGLKRFVEKKIRDGIYTDEADVVKDALRLLKEKDRLVSSNGWQTHPIASMSGADGSDIEAIAFLVMMQATKEADEDLKMILAEIKAMTAAKQKLRELISQVNKDVAANAGQRDKKPPLDFSSGLGTERAYHRLCIPYPDPQSDNGVKCVRTDLHPGKITDLARLEAIQNDLKSRLDGMSELSEMTSLRLQMMMDRRSKFIATLSNIMKKISDTQAAIVQNLK